jgi:hypothetical protein
VDPRLQFVSLAHTIEPDETIHAYAVRSVDVLPPAPDVAVTVRSAAMAEIFASVGESQPPGLVQFTRAEAIDYVYNRFKTVLDGYRGTHPDCPPIQIAFTGGDSSNRIVGECVDRYQSDHPDVTFHAVITSSELAESGEDLRETVAIADSFKIEHSIYDEGASAKVLGFPHGFAATRSHRHSGQPRDDAEFLAPSWAQELNFQVAYDTGRAAIIVGFNQEDVIVERVYQALTGQQFDPYPVRRTSGLDLIAPLHKVPKRLISALDLDNCIRSCHRTRPPVSPLRSSMYLMASHMVERLPLLATELCEPAPAADVTGGRGPI